jgi:hypothetical protein
MDLNIDEDDGRWNIVIIQKSLAIRVPSKCGNGKRLSARMIADASVRRMYPRVENGS